MNSVYLNYVIFLIHYGFATFSLKKGAKTFPDLTFIEANSYFLFAYRNAKQFLKDEKIRVITDDDFVRIINDKSYSLNFFAELSNKWFKMTFVCPKMWLIIIYVYDITAEHDAIVESKSFFTVNLDLLCIANTDGYFIKTNEARTKILGYTAAELNKHKFIEFVHLDDIAATMNVLAKPVAPEKIVDLVAKYLIKG